MPPTTSVLRGIENVTDAIYEDICMSEFTKSARSQSPSGTTVDAVAVASS